MKTSIVINIGNKGILISLIKRNNILEKFFIENFNAETMPIVDEFFKKYKKYNAYILLDTVAQNYNYKIFPKLNIVDLYKLVNRRFTQEIPKDDLKHKKFLYRNKEKKTVFLFISASTDSPVKEWLNFFNTISNNLLGLYMVPLESVELAKAIMRKAGLQTEAKDKNRWILFTFNDEVSDLRQVAIFNNQIAFTRLISLESAEYDLASFAQNDTIRTSEYIKRFDPDFTFKKLTIISILDKENKEKMSNFQVEDSLVLTYTPYEVATQLNINKNTIQEDEKYTDLILNTFALNNFKKTRFGNLNIDLVYNISLISFYLKYAIMLILILLVCFTLFFTILFTTYKNKEKKLYTLINKNNSILKEKSTDTFGMDSKEVDKIIEAGTIKEMVDNKYENPVESIQRFQAIQGEEALVRDIKWSIEKFDYQIKPNFANTIKTIYDISIINPDGDPNKLFYKYDILNQRLKTNFKGELNEVSTIPNNLNFNKKYLTYPIKIEISERK